jgi:phosphotransferase system  glucose/maltose/N-acetylglucosamine-specific IIC component
MIDTEKEAPKDSDKHIETSPFPAKFVEYSLAVYLYCCVLAIILKGWRTFFVGLGLTPIVTLAELFCDGACTLHIWLGRRYCFEF